MMRACRRYALEAIHTLGARLLSAPGAVRVNVDAGMALVMLKPRHD